MCCKYLASTLVIVIEKDNSLNVVLQCRNNYAISCIVRDMVHTFWYCPNKYERDLGIIPLSEYFSVPPVIVNVLPEPVCK